MKRKITEYLVEKLIERETIPQNEKALYQYGMSEGITIIQNILYTLLIGMIFGNIIETCRLPVKTATRAIFGGHPVT